MKQKEFIPAFPATTQFDENGIKDGYQSSHTLYTYSGMTLLDYFAGIALQNRLGRYNDFNLDGVTDSAYSIANSMLESRKKYIK